MQFVELPAGRDANPGNALQNLRDGFMVDRFTGARINRTIAGQANAVSMVTGDINNIDLTIQSVRDNADIAPGSYHISDRVIDLSAGALLADADGIHISFYNCTFVVTNYTADTAGGTVSSAHRFAFGITPLATDGARTSSARVNAAGNNQGTTRSINFYGCTIAQASTTERLELRCQLADAIGCDFRFAAQGPGGADIDIYPSPQVGGRWINNTFVTGQLRTDPASRIFTYGFPDMYEGIELYGLGVDVGLNANTVAGPRMLIEPNFSFPGQDTVFTYQANGDPAFADGSLANLFQNVGFFSPADNANNDGNDVIAARANAYLRFENGGGGCLNYAAYQPTFTDAITGTGIQNVRVRVNTSVRMNIAAGATTSTANFPRRLLTPGDDQTIGTTGYIGNEYITDTNGRIVSSRYTTDGWQSSTPGYYDPMIFDVRTDITTNPGRLASNTLVTPNLTPPEHTALALIQDMRGQVGGAGTLTTNAFTRHSAEYDAFSWSHDINIALTENSTTLFDGSARATRTQYGINTTDVSTSAPNIVGTLVKSSVTNSDNTPNLTALEGLFDQDDVPSINDVRMAYRYARYQFSVDGNPQTDDITLIVENSLDDAWMIQQGIVEVRGAGLAAKADDLFTADANLASVQMRGNPITGLTLGRSSTTWVGLLHSDTLPAATNSTLIGTYIPAGTTIDVTFNNCNLSGLHLNPLNNDQVVNVRGTDNNGVALTRSSFASIGGLGTVNFPAPTVTRTIETPDEAGIFGVLNVTTETVAAAASNTGGGTVGSFEIPAGSTDTFRFYWKATNTAETGYSTTIIERSNVGLTMSMTETMAATPLIATLYSGDTSIGTANVEAPVADSRAGRNMGMRILVNNDTTTTGAASQYHILTATNSTRYIDTLMNNNQSADIIVPDSISSSVSNARWVQIDTQTTGEQQQLVGTQFNNLEPGQPEQLQRSILPFVTRLDQLTDRDRFYLRNATDLLQDSERFPGTIGGDQLAGYTLTVVDEDNSSLFSQDIRNILGRFNPNMYSTLFGTIDIRNTAGDVQANYSYTGIELTSTEITFTLTAHNSGTNLPLNDPTVGITSGNTTVSLSGESRTGLQTDQVVQITGTGFSFPSVILFPNPAGATPAQIEQAATNAVNNSTAIANTRNGVGYLIGTGGDSRLVGIKPRATNYDSTQNYGENL